MTPLRVFVPIGTAEYAKLWGVSQRTARRRLAAMPGATKVGTRWLAPVYATEYAKRSGVSVKTARRKGIRAATATDALDVIAHEASKKLRDRGAEHLLALVKKLPPVRDKGRARFREAKIRERMQHASEKQIRAVIRLTNTEWLEITADPDWIEDMDWLGDDGISILYYH